MKKGFVTKKYIFFITITNESISATHWGGCNGGGGGCSGRGRVGVDMAEFDMAGLDLVITTILNFSLILR